MIGFPSLPTLRSYASRRASSFDRSGGNRDWFDVDPGERKVLAELDGPGVIRHIWMTLGLSRDDDLRRIVLRFTWDDAVEPSVECPIGDFFGLGHGRRRTFHTAMLDMSPQDGRGFNSWWPMPFRRRARIEVENPGPSRYSHYFYIDYELFDSPAALDGQAYFHVQWRRENPTIGWGDEYNEQIIAPPPSGGRATPVPPTRLDWDTPLREPRPAEWFERCWYGGDPRSRNASPRSAAENYVILAAAGDGLYCGAHLDIDIATRQKNDWYGEGDDMTFLDDDLTGAFDPAAWSSLTAADPVAHAARSAALAAQLRWPPTLHGTGTEDWCNTAFCPRQEHCGPYHGVLLHSGDARCPWRGKQTIYRYYVADPIRFRKRILATIEHGHANKLSNDYASTAYYYLAVPSRGGPPLPPVEQRLPRPDLE